MHVVLYATDLHFSRWNILLLWICYKKVQTVDSVVHLLWHAFLLSWSCSCYTSCSFNEINVYILWMTQLLESQVLWAVLITGSFLVHWSLITDHCYLAASCYLSPCNQACISYTNLYTNKKCMHNWTILISLFISVISNQVIFCTILTTKL